MKLKAAQESGMTVEHVQVSSDSEAQAGSNSKGKGSGVKEIERLVKAANTNPTINGLLVQLPLEGASPEEERRVVESVGVDKDVDGFHPENIGHLSSRLSTPLFTPCTPAGVIKLIDSSEFLLGLVARQASGSQTHVDFFFFLLFLLLLRRWCGLSSAGVKIEGSNTVVLGRSDIVGTPVCALLRRRDATVTQCHSRTLGLEGIVRSGWGTVLRPD